MITNALNHDYDKYDNGLPEDCILNDALIGNNIKNGL